MGSATLSGCQEAQILFFLKGKNFSMGIVMSAAACYKYFGLVIMLHVEMSVPSGFKAFLYSSLACFIVIMAFRL